MRLGKHVRNMTPVMSDQPVIYLDAQSTTPCDPRVVEVMAPFASENFGNPASRTHAYGWEADRAVEAARTQIARGIGADPREIVFTSGATEANNLAIFGLFRASSGARRDWVTCRIEHRSVLDPVGALAKEGANVRSVGVDRNGRIDLDALRDAITDQTLGVSVMHVNNEIGVIQPIQEIAALAKRHGAIFHSDAAQSVGKLPLGVNELGVDLLSISAHKLYGPKGIGALYVRRKQPPISLRPLILGGGHERGLRSGTLATPLCVGFGHAVELAISEQDIDTARISNLSQRLLAQLLAKLPDVELNGAREGRLPGNLNLSFLGVEAEALLLSLPEVALSTGAACTSAKRESSHVLRALGLNDARTQSAVRFGIGRFTTETEIDVVTERVIVEVERMRARHGRR